MPASAGTDVITPVHDALELALGASCGAGSSSKDIDSALVASARKALLEGSKDLQFVPARKSYNSLQDSLKGKYTWLGANSQTGQSTNTATKEHIGMLNGKDQLKASQGSPVDDGIPPPKVVLFNGDRIDVKWGSMQPARVGLVNMGNTCFLNSTLQCLIFTAPLSNYLLTGYHSQDCKANGFCMMCEMQHLVKKCVGPQTSSSAVQPLSVLQKIKMIAKHMSWGRQEDAHEFLRYVIDSMQKACLLGHNNLDRYSKETTIVHQVFGGYLRSQVRCLQCKAASDTYDPALDISIDIKNASSVERALQKFVQPEVLDIDNAYMCQRCHQKVRAQKRFTIHRAPKVLTMQLKRFDYHRQLGGKVSKHVEFTEKLNIRPFMSKHEGDAVVYQLYAVLVHAGTSCNSGHYYCYVRAPNHAWYCMNDACVTQASVARVLAAEAYILFYVRAHHSTPMPNGKLSQHGATLATSATGTPMMPGDRTLHGISAQSCSTMTPVIAKPSLSTGLPARLTETLPAKYVNGPKTLDCVPLTGKVSFSLTSASAPVGDRPRLILHQPKKLLPSLTAQQHSAPVTAAVADSTSNLNAGSSAGSSRTPVKPLVPYKDEDESLSMASVKDKTAAPNATGASAKMARLSVKNSSNATSSSTQLSPRPPHGSSTCGEDHKSSGPTSLGETFRGVNNSQGKIDALHDRLSPPVLRLSRPGSATAKAVKDSASGHWHVIENNSVMSPSVRSERSNGSCSTTSVNSTQEWDVQLKQDCVLRPSRSVTASASGWRITGDGATADAVTDEVVSIVDMATGDAGTQLSCMGKVQPSSPPLCSPRPALCAAACGMGDTASHSVATKPYFAWPLRGGCDSSDIVEANCEYVGQVKTCKKSSGTKIQEKETKTCSATADVTNVQTLPPAANTSICCSDYASKASDDGHPQTKPKKKRKHKKHKKASEKDANSTRLLDSDNDSNGYKRRHDSSSAAASPSFESKKRKKHKKKKKHHRHCQDESSGSEQWVEITKENFAEKKLIAQKPSNGHTATRIADKEELSAAASCNGHSEAGDQCPTPNVSAISTIKQVPKWDGMKKSSVTHLLERHSLAGYGTAVSSWDGSKSQLNREADEERKQNKKRSWRDDYEEDLDRGKVKKIKNKTERSDSPDYNRLQRLQDVRNFSSGKSHKWQQDREKGGARATAF